MSILRSVRNALKANKRKKRVKKLPAGWYRHTVICEGGYVALWYLGKIEKKSRKKCLDMVIDGFYSFYEKNYLNKTKLFSKEKYPIETVGTKRYGNIYYSKESYDALCIMAKNEQMTKKRCLDNIILWFYSYYMGHALKENNIRRKVNELLPKGIPKIRPSKAVRVLRKRAVEAGLGSYPTIVRRGL